MPNTAKDWRLYIPTGTGAFDCPLPVHCGDILDVVDNATGIQQTSFQLDVRTGAYFSTWRSRTPQLSQMTIQVTEEGAAGIDALRVPDCMSWLQRRLYCADTVNSADWELIEHYSKVNYGERGLTAPTAQGIDVRDDVPMVQVQTLYENRTWLDKSNPCRRIVEDVGYPLLPIETLYCDDPSCGYIGRTDIRGDEEFPRNNPPGDGCDTMFSLYAASAPSPDTFYLERSDDGGDTWVQITTDIVTSFAPNMMHCYYGRVFIGFGEEVYFSDDAVFGTVSTWTRITAFNEPQSIGPILDVIMIPPGSGGRVIGMAHSRWGLYALYSDGTDDNGVARCWKDRGDRIWEPVLPAGPERGTYFDIDVAGYGTVVAISGYGDDEGTQVGEITFNYVFGSFSFITTAGQVNTWYTQQYSGVEFGEDPEFIAITLASYNPNYNRSVFAYIWNSTTDSVTGITTNRIMKSKDLEGFVTMYEHVEEFTNIKRAKLENALDGVVVWGHRHSVSARDTLTVKSIDGGCTWIRFEDDKFTYGEVLVCIDGVALDELLVAVFGVVGTCGLQVGSLVCASFADGTVKIAEVFHISSGDDALGLRFNVNTRCSDNGGLVAITCHPDDDPLTPCPPSIIVFDSAFALCEHDPNVACINGTGIATQPPYIGPAPPPIDIPDGFL